MAEARLTFAPGTTVESVTVVTPGGEETWTPETEPPPPPGGSEDYEITRTKVGVVPDEYQDVYTFEQLLHGSDILGGYTATDTTDTTTTTVTTTANTTTD